MDHGETFQLLVPGGEDEDTREVLSWDRDGDGTLAYGEIRCAAVALLEARAKARSWKRRTFMMAAWTVAVLGVIFGVAFGTNELTREVGASPGFEESDPAMLRSASGKPVAADVRRAVGPTLFELPLLSFDDVHHVRAVTVPLTNEEGGDFTGHVTAVEVSGSLDLNEDVQTDTDLDNQTIAEDPEFEAGVQAIALGLVNAAPSRRVAFTFGNGWELEIRADGTADLRDASGELLLSYTKGPYDAASNQHDVVISSGEATFAPEAAPASDGNTTQGSTRRQRVSGHHLGPLHQLPVHAVPTFVSLSDLWEGHGDHVWHTTNNVHWARRCVVHHPDGSSHHFPGGLRDAAHGHAHPVARRVGTVSPLQDAASADAGAVVAFTRVPVAADADVDSLVWPEPLPWDVPAPRECPEYDAKFKYKASFHSCKRYHQRARERFTACERTHASGTAYARESCKRAATREVCSLLCTSTTGRRISEIHSCGFFCNPRPSPQVYLANLVAGPDGTVVSTSTDIEALEVCGSKCRLDQRSIATSYTPCYLKEESKCKPKQRPIDGVLSADPDTAAELLTLNMTRAQRVAAAFTPTYLREGECGSCGGNGPGANAGEGTETASHSIVELAKDVQNLIGVNDALGDVRDSRLGVSAEKDASMATRIPGPGDYQFRVLSEYVQSPDVDAIELLQEIVAKRLNPPRLRGFYRKRRKTLQERRQERLEHVMYGKRRRLAGPAGSTGRHRSHPLALLNLLGAGDRGGGIMRRAGDSSSTRLPRTSPCYDNERCTRLISIRNACYRTCFLPSTPSAKCLLNCEHRLCLDDKYFNLSKRNRSSYQHRRKAQIECRVFQEGKHKRCVNAPNVDDFVAPFSFASVLGSP